ncbi:MAG TPA: sigma-54 dependent transcriptional regulator [Myxococcaceae bacterium]|nr:sigma-54 dependent transcriptional regulator [Myxococcaceae bacterium]
MSRILIVEDEAVIRTELGRLLSRTGHDVAEAGSVAEAERHQPLDAFDLVIADLRLPGGEGTQLISLCGRAPVLIMTSYATVRAAVGAMQMGAVDFIAKPFDHDEMLMVVGRILRQGRLERQNAALKQDLERSYAVAGMVGNCPAMREVFERVRKVAPTDTTVLILGDSGTGKELVARAVHEQSPRQEAPIIAVNCASIPETLIESELFGHEKGAFTGAHSAHEGLVEAADGGTLFLDEIGELPMPAQARLLRVMQQGEVRRVGATVSRRVNVRLIAATHRNLRQMVRDGRFREDLYFRLRVLEIQLPPLRDRGEDVPVLADFLLAKACRRLNRAPLSFTAEARQAISIYDWPGNVRELENAIERAVILCESGPITPELLAIDAPLLTPSEAHELEAETSSGTLEEYFRKFVLEHQHRLSETELARRLGISRKALWEKRQRLGIPRPKLQA